MPLSRNIRRLNTSEKNPRWSLKRVGAISFTSGMASAWKCDIEPYTPNNKTSVQNRIAADSFQPFPKTCALLFSRERVHESSQETCANSKSLVIKNRTFLGRFQFA